MKEEYVDELDDTLDDVEPVVDNPAELYEHFRVVVDKGPVSYTHLTDGQKRCLLISLRATPVLCPSTVNRLSHC